MHDAKSLIKARMKLSCLRYDLLPMSPVRTTHVSRMKCKPCAKYGPQGKMAEGMGLTSNLLHFK